MNVYFDVTRHLQSDDVRRRELIAQARADELAATASRPPLSLEHYA